MDADTDSSSEAAGDVTRLARLQALLAERRRLVLAILLLIGGLTRIALWHEWGRSPGLTSHLAPASDMASFHEWALTVARGDWLSRDVRPPLHGWHEQIAAVHRQRADGSGALNPGPATADAAETTADLWRRWRGGNTFFQDPLYPYLMGATYWLLGPDPRWVILLQFLIGLATSALVWRLTCLYFGDVAGAIAGVMVLGYAPSVFYETVLLRTTVITFVGLLAVFLLERLFDRRSWQAGGLAGAAIGAAVLAKGTFLVLAAAFLALLLVERSRQADARAKLIVAFIVGIALVLAAPALRNVLVGAPALALASNGSETFAHSNSPSYSPQLGMAYSAAEVAAILGRSEGRLPATLRETLRSHPSVSSYLRLVAAKAAVALHWYELPNNVNFYYATLHLRVLRVLPFRFTLIGALGLVGVALAIRRRTCWPLLALCAVHALSLLLFFVLSRYRLPLAVCLIPFAAHCLSTLLHQLGRRHWWRSTGVVATALLLVALIGRGLPSGSTPIRTVDWLVPIQTYWIPRARAASEAGRHDLAVAILADALSFEPASIRSLGPTAPPASQQDRQLAGHFAKLHRVYAEALARAGRSADAHTELDRAQQLQSLTAPSSG